MENEPQLVQVAQDVQAKLQSETTATLSEVVTNTTTALPNTCPPNTAAAVNGTNSTNLGPNSPGTGGPANTATSVAGGTAPIIVTVNTAGAESAPSTAGQVVTIPVPIVPQEDTYVYVMVKGSLHDRSCQVFGLNEEEMQAVARRFENSVKNVVNGIMVGVTPTVMINTLALLNYKVVCASGEAEICWTMQREV